MHLHPLLVSTALLLGASTPPQPVSASVIGARQPSTQHPLVAASSSSSSSSTYNVEAANADPHREHSLLRFASPHPSLISNLARSIENHDDASPLSSARWDVWRRSNGASCASPSSDLDEAERGQHHRTACLDVQSSLAGEKGCQALLSTLDVAARSRVTCQVLQQDLGALVADQMAQRSDWLQRDVEAQAAAAEAKRHGKSNKGGGRGKDKEPRTRVELEDDEFHNVYHPLAEIDSHLDDLAARYPKLLELVEIGRTHEDRPIRVAKVSKKPEAEGRGSGGRDERDGKRIRKHRKGKGKKADDDDDDDDDEPEEKMGVLITGGMHAREWIGASVSLYFLSHLLSASSQSDARVDSILERFDISLLPVSNPDGYAYTWEADRMWRKNRQPNEGWLGARCPGIDLNRGFPFQWEHTANPCSESYAGPSPLSSLENQAIASYISPPPTLNESSSSSSSGGSGGGRGDDNLRASSSSNIGAYIDLHSYGQQLLYPFSYSCLDSPADEEDLVEVGIGAANALRKVHRKSFEVGRTCETLYPSSGSSIDYAYSAGSKWSFSIELRDQGSFGFLLPQDSIRPSGEETTVGLLYLLEFVARKERRG